MALDGMCFLFISLEPQTKAALQLENKHVTVANNAANIFFSNKWNGGANYLQYLCIQFFPLVCLLCPGNLMAVRVQFGSGPWAPLQLNQTNFFLEPIVLLKMIFNVNTKYLNVTNLKFDLN